MRKPISAICAGLTAVALVGATAAVPAGASPNNNSPRKLTKAVTVEGVLEHLEAFQDIADTHGDRASGNPGYKASVDYVVEQLQAAGYEPEVQEFTFDYFDENSELERVDGDAPRSWVNDSDFTRNVFVPTYEGEDQGPLQPVDVLIPPSEEPNGSSSGCDESDFDDFEAGSVALMQRGTCDFSLKALNAQAAGAVAAVVMNEGQPGRDGLFGMLGDTPGLAIPVVSTTYATGLDLYENAGDTVRVKVDFDADQRTTYNVLAETAEGRDDNVVMAGAHLDSVHDGAGINDNGTGSAGLLETAIQMKKTKPNNKVRFAWWGAEESGLLGAEHYVGNLSQEQIDDIALYLNFDMIGSPNYMFGIYDGDNSGETAEEGFIPEGSAEIEDVFEKFYTDRGEPYQDSEFSGRSDYGPFIAVGVPAGGLFTGAEGVKTEEEAELYGGVAGASYDPCYHAPCDNLTGEGQDPAVYGPLNAEYDLVGNVNKHALDVNSDAVATAVITFAFDTSTVNGETSPGKSHGKSKGKSANEAMKGRFTR